MLSKKIKKYIAVISIIASIQASIFILSEEFSSVNMELEKTNLMLKETQSNLLEEYNKNSKIIKDLREELNDSKHNSQVEIEKLKKLNESYEKMLDKLTSDVSFNPNNLREPSNATKYHLRRALKGTALDSEGLALAFERAEESYHVNAMFLVGLVANESGWGTSHRAKSQNNMSGFEVYHSNSRGKTFNSKEESILVTAKILDRDYLNEKGIYYSGNSIWNVNQNYCQSSGGVPMMSWSATITEITNNLVDKTNSQVHKLVGD